MATYDDKAAASHVDNVEQVSNESSTHSPVDSNEQIIHELETHGEEIGLTWRSILAAAVSLWDLKYVSMYLKHKSDHGFMLQRVSFHSSHSPSDSHLYQYRSGPGPSLQ